MFVICPMSNCGSPQKRDRFLEYLSKISPVTLQTESQCQAYAWFRSAEDNDVVPHSWLRGLEVYETVEANTVAHRSSDPYKKFRAAVAEEALLDRPSDLQFWMPTGIGFLSCPGDVNIMRDGLNSAHQYAIFNELRPRSGMKSPMLLLLRVVAELATHNTLKSFWVLDRGSKELSEDLLVFSLFASSTEANAFENDIAGNTWVELESMCEFTRRTTWETCGVGFIGR